MCKWSEYITSARSLRCNLVSECIVSPGPRSSEQLVNAWFISMLSDILSCHLDHLVSCNNVKKPHCGHCIVGACFVFSERYVYNPLFRNSMVKFCKITFLCLHICARIYTVSYRYYITYKCLQLDQTHICIGMC